MNPLERYFHAPFAGARAYLLSRLFLLLVALDTWMLMIGHAGRYGVDGFNVAHFGWLDRIAPQPTAALYIAVLLLSGLLALTVALGPFHRAALTALFLLYTFSWAMSMLDSYQHHYFVSLALLCLVFFPKLSATDVHPAPRASSSTPAPSKPKRKNKLEVAARAGQRDSQQRSVYVLVVVLAVAAYLLWSNKESRFVLFGLSSLAIAAATLLYARRRELGLRLADGFGFNLLGVTIAILYAFTSIAKMDPQWIEGHTITRISAAARVFAPLVSLAASFGIPEPRFWSLFASSVIPVELTIAFTYLIALPADSSRSPWPRRIALLGWFLAMTLHLGAEAMELEIGWFSYYMMVLACVFLLPARLVDTLATVLTWPATLIQAQLADLLRPAEGTITRGPTYALAGAAAVTLVAVGKMLDLPGALAAGVIAALACVSLAVLASARGGSLAVRPALLASAVAAALMWASIANSEARWDFYRFLGGDLKRRGEPEAALEAYERGERYAPKGESRKDQIEALRKQLGR